METRWEGEGKLKSKVFRATHGDATRPLKIGNLEIPCYVLEDGSRVLSGRGMQAALDLGQRHGGILTQFVARKNIKPFIGNDLAMALSNPIRFIRPGRGGKLAVGFEATMLADLCDAVLKARESGNVNARELLVAQQCEILTRAFAKVGIIALVDEATGYQDHRDRDALAKILEAFVAKELKKWIRTFEPDFYKELFRLRGLSYDGTCKKPSYIGHLTNDLVYSRLAPGVLQELRKKNPKQASGNRKAKHHQWLTEDFGHKKLENHLTAVTALMRGHDSWKPFHDMLEKSLPKYTLMPLWEDQGVSAE